MKHLKEDMTYNEVESCKVEIKKFIAEINAFEGYSLNIKPDDESFFIVISKHILFLSIYICVIQMYFTFGF